MTNNKTSHCSNMISIASHPKMGDIFWFWRMEVVSAYMVSVLLYNSMSHLCATIAASGTD